MTEPQELAWCPGWGEAPLDWLEECQECQRRTMADRGGQRVTLAPLVALWCEDYVPPDRPEDQRLRELAGQTDLLVPPS